MATATTTPTAIGRAKPRWWNMSRRRTLIGYIFILPFILGVLAWLVIPAAVSGWLSFQDWNILTPPKPVGLANFKRLLTDKLFWQALKVTINYTLISVPLGLVISFILAMLLNTKVRGIRFFRTVFYLPSIVPAVANAVLWAWIFNSEFGLLNLVLRAFGIPKIGWLIDPKWVMPALIIVSLWGVGGAMVIYLAGLQGIPREYYEASEIDGAGRWAQLWNITLPMMSPVIFFNLVQGIIGSFQVFTIGYLLTDGGPQNATLFYVLYLYRNAFTYFEMGYATALAWVLFLVILLLTLLVVKYLGGRVYYEEPR